MPCKFLSDSRTSMQMWMQDSFCSYEWGNRSLPEIKIGFISPDCNYHKQKMLPVQERLTFSQRIPDIFAGINLICSYSFHLLLLSFHSLGSLHFQHWEDMQISFISIRNNIFSFVLQLCSWLYMAAIFTYKSILQRFNPILM